MTQLKSSYIFPINILLSGQYEVTQKRDIVLGSYFGFSPDNKTIGLRIPGTTEINTVAVPDANSAIFLTTAQLANFAIDIFDVNGKAKHRNLPLAALAIDGSIEIHADPFYQIDCRIDWSKCILRVVNPLAAPAAGTYLLRIYCVFQK